MLSRGVAAAGLICAAIMATPASAGRTVIDAGMQTFVSGYCSPAAVGTADCEPKSLGFTITLGARNYDSFVVHSNGVVSLGSAIDYADRSATISSFRPPVFSPLLDNGSYYVQDPNKPGQGNDDGRFVADYAMVPGKLTLRWYPCTTKIFCGPQSVDASFYSGGSLSIEQIEQAQNANWSIMTIIKQDQGFSVDFSYTPRYDYAAGMAVPSTTPIHYGFDLPTASLESDGAAVSRTFQFDGSGALVASAVPEPATWLGMTVGFGMLAIWLRRKRIVRRHPADNLA